MSLKPRKRFSAFEDFPTENIENILTGKEKASSPLENSVPGEAAAKMERIERLKPSQMIPDRFQPRRLLPTSVRADFFSGKIDCYMAATKWQALAKIDRGYLEEIERLLAMGDSFEEHGQIKPITGSWVPTPGGRYIFLIETGERRFWAACLRTVKEKLKEELLLRVEVVEKPTRHRQVLENRHAESPSAVGQACEVAALILAEMGIAPDPNLKDEFEYFRKAKNQRMPAGLWEKVMPVMQFTRVRMVQLLNILQFPNPMLEMADRYRLPERVLREVLAMPRNQWERMIQLSVQNNLTSDDVADLSGKRSEKIVKRHPASLPDSGGPGIVAASGLRRFANAITRLDEISQAQTLDEVADELVITREAEGMLNLLGELARLIQARLSRQ